MKKILSALMFAICILSVNFCYAGIHDYYENHPDYRLFYSHQGYYSYLYVPSIDVQEYNPPHYQIGYKLIDITEILGTNEKKWRYDSKRYNWYTKETFSLKNGYWVKDEVQDNLDSQPVRTNRKFADALFRAAYGMDFYGY